jgi:1,4-alpha-glucan branching enzyme
MRQAVKDLNHLYHHTPALYAHEFEWTGFDWIDCHDSDQSTLSYVRKSDDEFMVVVLNFTPVPRHGYRIGVPAGGGYREVFNSDSEYYAGSNLGNGPHPLHAEDLPWMGRPYSLAVTLPPLAGIVLKPDARWPG